MGAVSALNHRVAHSAAWDEYDRMIAEADEARRNGNNTGD